MPFTFSHIVAVLPFRKNTPQLFSMPALIIGSMVPDFEYFLRMTLYGHYGHTLPGIISFDLPVGILLYLVYHLIVRRPLTLHLPGFLYRKSAGAENIRWLPYFKKKWYLVLFSVLTGTLTHLVWDGFTHDEEYIVAGYFPLLLQTVTAGPFKFPLHFLLQMISSIAGLLILLIYIIKLPSSPSVHTPSSNAVARFWSAVLLLAIIIFVLRLATGIPQEKFAAQLLVVSISAGLFSLVLVCSFYLFKNN
ncbi:MAG: DUF4184 family protein [Pseudobacter sp.]|uniref:DUF4184 family protein n=1 Tax=Pseudobacter sp. TaxID=2045420 RepID=UPI003F7CDA23